MNKYTQHVLVIPEDRADEQLANGFVEHDQVKTPRIQVMEPAGGWQEVLRKFQIEYVPYLQKYPDGFVVMLIDFDGQYANRRAAFAAAIPPNLQQRVFVIGPSQTPEDLKKAMGKSFEDIGKGLANDCFTQTQANWSHPHLVHNNPDCQQLVQTVKPFLF